MLNILLNILGLLSIMVRVKECIFCLSKVSTIFTLCLMTLHIAALNESLSTKLADMGAFSGMGHPVLRQILYQSIGGSANITFIRLLPSMHSLMHFFLGIGQESLWTTFKCASKRPFICVDQFEVFLTTFLCFECFAAAVTDMFSTIRMRSPLVSQKFAFAGEPFFALVTAEV